MNGSSNDQCLGLEIGHRELFFAAQSGWLPASTGTAQSGRVLVQGGYAACPRDMLAANEIPVRLEVDPRRLWSIPGAPSGIHLGEGRLLWLSPLSLTAVRRLAASTEEQSVRLRNMAKRAGNVGLPNVPLEVDGCAGRMVPPHTAQEAAEAMEATGFLGPAALTLDEGLKRLAESTTRAGRERRPWDLPLGFDPLRGAMTAAAWVAGWSGLVPKPLQSAVRSAWGSQDGKLCIGGINVTLPWPDNPVVGRAVDGEDDAVWTAALEASLRTPDGSGPGESAMISRIRGIMGQMGHLAYASRWAERASQVNRLQASLFDVPGVAARERETPYFSAS